MLHNFDTSLRHEREQAGNADKFYISEFGAQEIERYCNDSVRDLKFQHKDIDVSMIINEKRFYISEKFRDRDYGDMYLEVYSKYPSVNGWIHSGSPDFIVYFTPKAVYCVAHKTLREFCLDKLFPQIPDEWYEEIHSSGKASILKTMKLDSGNISLRLIQAHNQTEDASWETLGIAIRFEVLKKHGIKVKRVANVK
jgi:hypothetical protein